MGLFARKPSLSRIVVFLGNPGQRFEGTRHNVGFLTGDLLSRDLNVKINRSRFRSLTAQTVIEGETVLLMKPQTYMNLSGDAVREAMRFYKVPLDHIVVVSDDVSLPVGKIRVRRGGSAGGHNGLKDIIAKCGGDGFPRVRIGVGEKPHPDYDMADWVPGAGQKNRGGRSKKGSGRRDLRDRKRTGRSDEPVQRKLKRIRESAQIEDGVFVRNASFTENRNPSYNNKTKIVILRICPKMKDNRLKIKGWR